MKQRYSNQKLNAAKQALIEMLNQIVEEYVAQGFRLTVRQLYYQAIARDILPDDWMDREYNARNGLHADTKNTVKNYKRLAGTLDEGKMAGMVDWDAIEDRTREFNRKNRYKGPSDILEIAARAFHMDLWTDQGHRCFVVVEKEALAGVLEGVCHKWDVPLLAARGYPSGTVLREFAVSDLVPTIRKDQTPVIIHLGDHDPSGIDMSRDLAERFCTFTTGRQGARYGDDMFKRVALNMEQIEEQKPPPNPAKATDARFEAYAEKYGEESWELDALQPQYIVELVERTVKQHIDFAVWKKRVALVEGYRAEIQTIANNFKKGK